MRVWGQSPQKLEIYTECITNFIESVIACSNRSKLIGRKKIYPYDGGGEHAPIPPWLRRWRLLSQPRPHRWRTPLSGRGPHDHPRCTRLPASSLPLPAVDPLPRHSGQASNVHYLPTPPPRVTSDVRRFSFRARTSARWRAIASVLYIRRSYSSRSVWDSCVAMASLIPPSMSLLSYVYSPASLLSFIPPSTYFT